METTTGNIIFKYIPNRGRTRALAAFTFAFFSCGYKYRYSVQRTMQM